MKKKWSTKTVVGALMGVVVLFANEAVFAQEAKSEAERAASLFRDGVAQMKTGKFVEGCPLIAESHKIEPTAGKLFTLAECERNAGRIATASARYQDYLSQFSTMTGAIRKDHEVRSKIAREHAEALAIDIPQLTVRVLPEMPPNARVFRDDLALEAIMIGVGLPVNPGEHTVRLEVRGKPDLTEHVRLDVRQKSEVVFRVRPVELPKPVIVPNAKPVSQLRITAISTGALGFMGSIVGFVTGGMLMARADVIKAECPNKICQSKGAFDLVHEAQTLAVVNNIGFGVGIAGLATGAVLFIVDSKRQKKSLIDGIDGRTLHIDVIHAGQTGARIGIRGGF